MNGIYDHAFSDGILARLLGIDRPLGEGFVARDKDSLVYFWVIIPLEFIHRTGNDGTAKLAAAARRERKRSLLI